MDIHATTRETTMMLVKGIQHGFQRSRNDKGIFRKPGFHRLRVPLLIPFHGEHIIGLLVKNRLGNSFLAAYRDNGDQAAREHQTRKERGISGDIIGFTLHCFLP
jgi:hypothetical protein